MVELRNTFKIITERGETAFFNTVLISPARALSDTPYARYLKIYTDKGAAVFSARQTVINSNQQRGVLKAFYAVTLSKDDLAGEVITGFALTPDGVTDINYAAAGPYTKSASEEITVMAEVYLTPVADKCVLVQSDRNALVRALLGADALTGNIYAQWGTFCVGNEYGVSDTVDKPENRVPVTVEQAGNGMRFICDVPQGARDAVIFFNGAPGLRISIVQYLEQSVVVSGNVTDEFTLNADAAYVGRASSAIQNGVGIGDLQAHYVPEGFYKDPEPLVMNFDRGLTLLNDPYYNAAAFIGEKELFYIKIKNGKPAVAGILEISGAQAFLPDDNEVALVYPEKMCLYTYGAEDGFTLKQEIGFAKYGTGRAMVTKRYGKYAVMRDTESGVESAKVSGSLYNVGTYYSRAAGEILFRNRFQSAAVWGGTNPGAVVMDSETSDTQLAGKLTDFMRNNSVVPVSASDGLVHCVRPDNPVYNFVYAPFANKGFVMPSGAAVTLCGDFVLAKLTDGRRQLYFYYCGYSQLTLLAPDDVSTIAEVARIKGYLLVRRDNGRLDLYLLKPGPNYIYCASFIPGQRVNAVLFGLSTFTEKARRITLEIT